LDLELLLLLVIDVATELTTSQASSILLYDKKSRKLQFVASQGAHRESLKQIQVPLDKSVAGRVFKHGRPLIIQEAAGDPRVFRGVDQAVGFETHSMLAVPLIFREETIGVLEAVNKLSDQMYTDEDMKVLEILATQAAIAIQNARFMEDSRRAYQELADLDRMKTDFIAIASHELRTPLGLILGHSTFMREMVDDELKPQLDVIVRSATRLKDIIEDVSKIDTFESGASRVRKGEIDVKRMVREVLEAFESTAEEKGIALTSNLPGNQIVVEGEVDKIKTVLNNLVKNSLTFTDEGGHVMLTAEDAGEWVQISIIDNGIGIPEDERERIFDRFYQVESHMTRKHGGMGLGLSVAKMMVELHGGSIEVQSVVGEGSKFTVNLPKEIKIPDEEPELFR
jgi:signal transduction histidine kinase